MRSQDRDIASIGTYRGLTEQRLMQLLEEFESDFTLGRVRNLILEADHTSFNAYVIVMLSLFNYDDVADADDAVLQVIQDAWNYLPHRSLNGRCPAEIMMQNAHT
jgi:hypothetical protein